jgi:hypothetical protein
VGVLQRVDFLGSMAQCIEEFQMFFSRRNDLTRSFPPKTRIRDTQ